jgi:hypothetical protein
MGFGILQIPATRSIFGRPAGRALALQAINFGPLTRWALEAIDYGPLMHLALEAIDFGPFTKWALEAIDFGLTTS